MIRLGYDTTKEGKEPFKKLWAACKLSAIGTTITGGLETIVTRPSPNVSSALLQGGRHLLGWTSITTTFTATVLFLTNIRKKDDPWNYFLGANAACAVFYSISRKGPTAFGFAIWTSIGAAILKAAHLRGYDPFDFSNIKRDSYTTGIVFENSPDVSLRLTGIQAQFIEHN